MAPRFTPTPNHLYAWCKCRDNIGQHLRRVLSVSGEHDQEISARHREAASNSCMRSNIGREIDNPFGRDAHLTGRVAATTV